MVQLLIRLGLLGLLIFWTFVLMRPFVPILAWAFVLAAALNPAFVLLAKILGGRPTTAIHDLFPLPATELVANPNLKQNPGF